MPKSSSVLSEFLMGSRILIENARNLPEITVVLKGFGYTPERLAEGLKLLTDAEDLVQKQIKEYGESHEATESLNKAWEVANTAYMKTLKIARIVFGDETKAGTALKLYGPRKQTMSGWLEQASAFYGNLTSDKSLGDRLGKFGYTTEKITEEAALVEIVHKSLQSQAKEAGAAQQATVERDRKIGQLDTWVSELRAVSKVGFADDRQELEKLGITVLNAPRAKKKITPANAAVN